MMKRTTRIGVGVGAGAVAGAAALAVAGPVAAWAIGVAALTLVIAGAAIRSSRRVADSSKVGVAQETPIEIEGVGRRTALRYLGLGLVGAAPVMIAPAAVDRLVGDIIRRDSGPRSAGDALKRVTARTSDGRIRQWTMIIDLRYCDGCQSQDTAPQCTTSCIEGHFAPEPMQWIEVFEGHLPGGGTQFVPSPCMQCQNPPCVNVCPVGATFSTPHGTVLIDQDRCIGCRICMAACPYDRRFFNWGEPPIPPEALLADYTPDHQIHANRGTVMKCDFCPDMVRDGTLPFCIQACPNDAIWYGDLEENIATNGVGIVGASRFLTDNDAYRLKEHLGTDPRVYYIPGHGELVGRDPYTTGRVATEWPWVERAEGAVTWSR